MLAVATPLASSGAAAAPDLAWWQAVGGTLAVFALLLLFLRFLARWQRAPRQRRAALLAVVPLGPRREIEVLRLRDRVHYLYRHDGALVSLTSESWTEYENAEPLVTTPTLTGLAGLWRGRSRAARPTRGEG